MMDFKKSEADVLKFWKEKKIYEKLKKRNSNGKKFYFMDGPPYATGNIHMGTAVNKSLKDMARRAKRFQGFDVFDRPGYDTHGVPIEYQVEKEIGSKNKKDIEGYGVKKFVEKCKSFATRYIDVMNSEFMNLGVWMDWDNPYLTLEDKYIEAIWGVFKEAEKKGLLYKGRYPVHVCPRCETAVAFNEIEYGKQKDTSIFVKFPLKNKKNTFLVIWTTTPWTLPGNTGVMVNPEVVYQEIEVGKGERWIIAKDLVSSLMERLGRGFIIKDEYKGKKMEGWTYENPLGKDLRLDVKNSYRVVLSSRYVTTEEGTGLVHTAPGHGKEDYEIGKENGLDAPCPVGSDGVLTAEAGKYAGKRAREVDKEIIEDLDKEGYLVDKMAFEHDYPLCWRDKSPLLMVSIPQWFLKISKIQKKLLKENEKVNWEPKFMGLRMKAWLEGIGDWPVSRQRYWGAPLPIWTNGKERIIVGSINELKKLSGENKIDMHKPGIDEIVIKKNGKEFRRVPEVLDVWFDSGVSSWAALGYPQDKKKFKRYWPADLNIEGKDQFRGWWNSQMILSEILFDKKPFENIAVHGMVLDLEKSKMSKSKGNVVSPQEVIEKFGRDYIRYYFAKFSKGDDFSYDEKEFSEIRKVMTIFLNVNNFVNGIDRSKGEIEIEDKWILSKYNNCIREVTLLYNEFKFPEVIQRLERFLIEELSRAYIQIVRDRADETFGVLNEIRNGLIILYAPIIPFSAENLWKSFGQKEESVHLSSWPKVNLKKIDKKLEREFEIAMKIIETGLKERDKAGIGLRWPLSNAKIECAVGIGKELIEIIKKQLNVKEIEVKKAKELSVELDTRITEELEAEGFARELARKIQSERKKAGLQKGEVINLELNVSRKLKDMLERHLSFIIDRTNSKKIDFVDDKIMKRAIEFKIKDEKIFLKFS